MTTQTLLLGVDTSPWTIPAGVTSVTVECWGAGGGGGGNSLTTDGGSGGGGGAYSIRVFSGLIPGNTISWSIGAGGTAGAATADATGGTGGTTWFSTNDVNGCVAVGGIGGRAPTSGGVPYDGGAGGASASGFGTTKFSGGKGGAGRNSSVGRGGYGGMSAGTGADGTAGESTWSTTTALTPITGAASGGDGGTSGAGTNGAVGGGGGGGRGDSSGVGQVGGNGKIILTYTAVITTDVSSRAVLTSTISAGRVIFAAVTGYAAISSSSGVTRTSSTDVAGRAQAIATSASVQAASVNLRVSWVELDLQFSTVNTTSVSGRTTLFATAASAPIHAVAAAGWPTLLSSSSIDHVGVFEQGGRAIPSTSNTETKVAQTSSEGRATVRGGASFLAIGAGSTDVAAWPILLSVVTVDPVHDAASTGRTLMGSTSAATKLSITDVAGRAQAIATSASVQAASVNLRVSWVELDLQSGTVNTTSVSGRTTLFATTASDPVHEADSIGRATTLGAMATVHVGTHDQAGQVTAFVSEVSVKTAIAGAAGRIAPQSSSSFLGAGIGITDVVGRLTPLAAATAASIHEAASTGRATAIVQAVAEHRGAFDQIGRTPVRGETALHKLATTVASGIFVPRSSSTNVAEGVGTTDILALLIARGTSTVQGAHVVSSTGRVTATGTISTQRFSTAASAGKSAPTSSSGFEKVVGAASVGRVLPQSTVSANSDEFRFTNITTRTGVSGISSSTAIHQGNVFGLLVPRAIPLVEHRGSFDLVGRLPLICTASNSKDAAGDCSSMVLLRAYSSANAGLLYRAIIMKDGGWKEVNNTEIGVGAMPMVLMPDGSIKVRETIEGVPIILDEQKRFRTLAEGESLLS